MTTTEQEPGVPRGRYRHYKGGEYDVGHEVQHSETLEWLVLYMSVADGRRWVRPTAMFMGTVLDGGVWVRRFVPVPREAKGGL